MAEEGTDGRGWEGHARPHLQHLLLAEAEQVSSSLSEEATRRRSIGGSQGRKEGKDKEANRPGMKKVWALCQGQGLGQRRKGRGRGKPQTSRGLCPPEELLLFFGNDMGAPIAISRGSLIL